MSQRRGLVIERSGDKVTAITKSGEFVTWRDDRDLIPGEEVLLPAPRFQGFFWKRVVPATALAAILIVTSFFGYRQYLYARPVLAYVTFDTSGEVPASIELEVNDRGLVKRAVALDDAGAEALSRITVEMQSVQTVLMRLRETMPSVTQVIIAFIPVTEESAPESKMSSKVSGLAQRVFDSAGEATAVMLDMETRAIAQELGLSAGRAALWALWNLEVDALQEPGSEPGTAQTVDPGQAEPTSTEVQTGLVGSPDDEEPVGSQSTQTISGGPAGSSSSGGGEKSTQPGQGSGKAPPKGTGTTVHEDPVNPGGSTKPPSPPKPGGPKEPDSKTPPGQQKKADTQALLDMIKKSLPELKWDDGGKLDPKKSDKELEKLAKDWLKGLLEVSKSHEDKDDKDKEKDKDKSKDKDDDRDRRDKDDNKKESKGSTVDPKPASPGGSSSGNKDNSKGPGKEQEKQGKPDKQDKNQKNPKDKDKDDRDDKQGSGKGKNPGSESGSIYKGSDKSGDDKSSLWGSYGKDSVGSSGKKEPHSSGDKEDGKPNSGSSNTGYRSPLWWTSEFLRRLWK